MHIDIVEGMVEYIYIYIYLDVLNVVIHPRTFFNPHPFVSTLNLRECIIHISRLWLLDFVQQNLSSI